MDLQFIRIHQDDENNFVFMYDQDEIKHPDQVADKVWESNIKGKDINEMTEEFEENGLYPIGWDEHYLNQK